MCQVPFSITISVVSGDPNGLRIVEHSSWYGMCVMFPRSLLPALLQIREEFQRSAVYILTGTSPLTGSEMLYIGEADPVGERLKSHLAKKDFWEKAILFTGSAAQLNKTHVKFLESKLIDLARAAKRVELENKTTPATPSLSESEKIRAQGFLDNILRVLPLLGVSAFESTQQRNNFWQSQTEHEILVIRAKGIEAKGYESSQGFVVLKGSQAVYTPVNSMELRSPSYFGLRNRLLDQEVLIRNGLHLEFQRDYIFDSPTAAAAVVIGRSTNGRTKWKTDSGMTLRDLQTIAAEAASIGD